MVLLSSSTTSTRIPVLFPRSFVSKPHFSDYHNPYLHLSKRKKTLFSTLSNGATTDNGAGFETSATAVIGENPLENNPTDSRPKSGKDEEAVGPAATAGGEVETAGVRKFENPKWVNGTWDLKQFEKDGKTDWDAVIDAEARRRKWLENNPESSSNEDPVVFDTSIIPWWAWIKKFHLPEAELLNGRAAMIGFFMAYLVDSLTGLGVVDQTSNFFCKTMLFVAVAGVLLIRKNEDVETLKKLIEETTFYDKQWQAAWKDDTNSRSKTD
ncbi:hypothetical protein Nepgr_030671 [Nepenthes gracilis]|uniref:Uncharacterized protein n=1 Tax=Nepenthes gracilis TaxID=150966 RepID=A0AAD3Y4G7_NEPGR|nr:hypothetical protein Nepgr_030671 [Nepenthes gracilis]